MVGSIRHALCSDAASLINHVEVGAHRRTPFSACGVAVVKPIDLPSCTDLRVDLYVICIAEIDQPHVGRRWMTSCHDEKLLTWTTAEQAHRDEACAPEEAQVVLLLARVGRNLGCLAANREPLVLDERLGPTDMPLAKPPQQAQRQHRGRKGPDRQRDDV